MWYLNYCSPFIYNTNASLQTIRYILYSCLAVQLIIYIFYITKYKFFGQVIIRKNKINDEQAEEQQLHVIRNAKSYQGFGETRYRMDQKKFKEWYLHYFGLHSVAVAGCIMYSPYAPQLVFTIIHLLLIIPLTIMQSCTLKDRTHKIYNALLTISCLMDILLLFSVSMGVGASGYDSGSKKCFLNQS